MSEILYCENPEPFTLTPGQKVYDAFKRTFDFLIALIGLIICIIPFVFVAIAIKLDSKGPVLFKQPRIGKNGKLFNCIKFRSMSMDANHSVAGYEYAEVNNYITKVGKFIRKTSIDELPQLFNVLKGDMSFIGYRPSQTNETDLNTVREQFNLYQLRPGITGWAQVHGRDVLAANPTLKARYDGYYLKHYSFGIDVQIILKTIRDVLKHSDIQEGTIGEGTLSN